MYKYEEIRDELKKNRYTVYIVDNNEYKMAFKFNGSKQELKDKITKKYLKKNKDNIFFVIFKFTFHTGEKPLQGGPLAVALSSLQFLNNELISAYKHNDQAKRFMNQIWFQRKYLEEKGWDYNYFNIMISKLLTGKVKLYPLLTNKFNVKFI